jgi:hypothetical protein
VEPRLLTAFISGDLEEAMTDFARLEGERSFAPTYDRTLARECWLLAEQVDAYARSKRWGLTRRIDDHWISFSRDRRVAFGVGFHTKLIMGLYVKVSESETRRIRIPGHEPFRYVARHRQAEYACDSGSADLAPFEPLFLAGYQTALDG